MLLIAVMPWRWYIARYAEPVLPPRVLHCEYSTASTRGRRGRRGGEPVEGWDGGPGRSGYWLKSSFRQASLGRTESQMPGRVFASSGSANDNGPVAQEPDEEKLSRPVL